MNDKTLRSKLVRLAHANPEIRAAVLPLLRQRKKAGYRSLGELIDSLPGFKENLKDPRDSELDADDRAHSLTYLDGVPYTFKAIGGGGTEHNDVEVGKPYEESFVFHYVEKGWVTFSIAVKWVDLVKNADYQGIKNPDAFKKSLLNATKDRQFRSMVTELIQESQDANDGDDELFKVFPRLFSDLDNTGVLDESFEDIPGSREKFIAGTPDAKDAIGYQDAVQVKDGGSAIIITYKFVVTQDEPKGLDIDDLSHLIDEDEAWDRLSDDEKEDIYDRDFAKYIPR